MKTKILLASLVFASTFTLASCRSVLDYFLVKDIETDLDSSVDVIEGDESVDTTGYEDEILDRLPESVDGNALGYIEASDGNVIIAYNDKEAWLFDFVSDKVIPIVDTEKMLAAADIAGRSGDYFKGDLTVTPSVNYDKINTVKVDFDVKSAEGEYRVYAYYYCDRGFFSDYYYDSISFPGSEGGVTIDDLADFEKLHIPEDNYLFRIAKAIVENDVAALCEIHYLDEKILESWKGMEISEYTLTRLEFAPYVEELLLHVKIEKSNNERLTPGTYTLTLYEGPHTYELGFVSEENPRPVVESEAVNWISRWLHGGGGNNPDWPYTNPDDYTHSLLDFMIAHIDHDLSTSSAEEFREFCEKHFTVPPMQVSDEYVTNHGGHGGSHSRLSVTDERVIGDAHIITVEYYADPMNTVVARRMEFTLTDNGDGTYKLVKWEKTYDSGFRPKSHAM